MKKLLLIFLVFVQTESNAQDKFIWEDIKTVEGKSKEQLYSDSKMFIAKYWKSANHVIQNDDKESGTIMIRGISIQTMSGYNNTLYYYYRYLVTIQLKDGKYRLRIEDVQFDRAYRSSDNKLISGIDPCEGSNCKGILDYMVSKKKVAAMMDGLKKSLSEILVDYHEFVSKPSSDNEW